jgi:uncharacterized protein YegP (UPF0339 family)
LGRLSAGDKHLTHLTTGALIMAGKFELYTDVRGQFRFRLKAANGRVIAVGESYPTKAAALEGIEAVRRNAEAPLVDLTAAEKKTTTASL